MDLISVIVPVYKVEAYLPRCIRSLLRQSYKHLEILLIDDGSPDRCGEICDEYAEKDKRINVIHKENGGLPSARNAGLEIAKGEYVAFIDSDDMIESNYLELLYASNRQENSDISFCKFSRFDGVNTFEFKENFPLNPIVVDSQNEAFLQIVRRLLSQKNNFFGSLH